MTPITDDVVRSIMERLERQEADLAGVDLSMEKQREARRLAAKKLLADMSQTGKISIEVARQARRISKVLTGAPRS